MYLPPETFKTVVANTPLVSIDLIVRDRQGRVLLGWRRNRPAQDCWFVPGGRINKDETLAAAFQRLSGTELGVELDIGLGQFRGVFEHFYSDCFAGEIATTHYVVLAYELQVDRLDHLPPEQHARYCWLSPTELLAGAKVHENTKAYFQVG